MNFSSIKEYFYKLYNACYLMLLLPLGIFLFICYQIQLQKITPVVQEELYVLIIAGGAFVLAIINLTTVHWVSKKRLKSYASAPGLGLKLDRYYEIIFLRFAGGAISALLMTIGLLITGSQYFMYLFAIVLASMAIQWPTSMRACRDLRLKGDEYKMVFHKTENL